MISIRLVDKQLLVGGFNPSEKYCSNWIISLSRGKNLSPASPYVVGLMRPSTKTRISSPAA